MKKVLCALAALPLFSATALAQPALHANVPTPPPLLLSDQQMDGVSAGWRLEELEISNTSATLVDVYGRDDPTCSSCYLSLSSPAISVFSEILGGLPKTTGP